MCWNKKQYQKRRGSSILSHTNPRETIKPEKPHPQEIFDIRDQAHQISGNILIENTIGLYLGYWAPTDIYHKGKTHVLVNHNKGNISKGRPKWKDTETPIGHLNNLGISMTQVHHFIIYLRKL